MAVMQTMVMTRYERLQFARKRAGIPQLTMAEILGVNRATISDYETGRSELTVPKLLKWAMATSADLEWLTAIDLEYTPRDLNPEPTDFRPDDDAVFWALVERNWTPASVTTLDVAPLAEAGLS